MGLSKGCNRKLNLLKEQLSKAVSQKGTVSKDSKEKERVVEKAVERKTFRTKEKAIKVLTMTLKDRKSRRSPSPSPATIAKRSKSPRIGESRSPGRNTESRGPKFTSPQAARNVDVKKDHRAAEVRASAPAADDEGGVRESMLSGKESILYCTAVTLFICEC